MNKAYFTYLASLFLFGSNGVVASAIDAPSGQIALVRTSLASVMLLVVFLATRSTFTLHKSPRDLAFVAGSGCALGLGWIFLYLAYHELGVAHASLLYALGPAILVAASPLLFKERIGVATAAGLAVVLVGTALINGAGEAGHVNLLGLAWGMASAGCYAVMVALSKKAHAGGGLERTLVQLSSAAAAVAVSIVVARMPLTMPTGADVAPMLMLGFVNTGFGCLLYFTSITKLPTRSVAALSYLEPLSAVVFSAILLHEAFEPAQWLGAALVIAGAVFCELAGARGTAPHTRRRPALLHTR